MFTRADIRRVSIAVTEKDYSTLIVSLGRSGLVHIDSAAGGDSVGAVNDASVSAFFVDTAAAEMIISAADDFLSETCASSEDSFDYDTILDDIPSLFAGDSAADLHEAERIRSKTRQYAETRALTVKEIESLETKLAEIGQLRLNGIDPDRLRQLKYISYIYGRSGANQLLNFSDERIFYVYNGEYILALFPAELKREVNDLLGASGFKDIDSIIRPGFTLEDEEAAARGRIDELRKRMLRIDSFFHSQIHRWRERMHYLAAVYAALLKISGAQTGLMFSKELVVINGWINLKDAGKLRGLLLDECGNRFYFKTGSRLESRRFRDIMPVLLKNNPLLRPFELLVKMMGVPGNTEVDPTPAAALAYVVIFGVMFGDLGQGLVLVLAGFALNRYGKKRYGGRNNLSDFGSIMTWCGFSAAAFGLLYGSFFSNEHFIPALLFHPMENTMRLLFMAIMTGTVFISLGLLLNIINGLVAARYEESLFGSRGLPGIAIYGLFIFFALRFILAGNLPGVTDIAFVVALPMAVFCLRGPLEYIFFHGERMFHHGLFEYIVETMIKIIEMFSGFLGNTISYIRAGAFALSHAGLSIATVPEPQVISPISLAFFWISAIEAFVFSSRIRLHFLISLTAPGALFSAVAM